MINEEIDALIKLSEVYQALGHHSYSLKILQNTWELADKTNDGALLAAILGSKAKAYLSMGLVKEAQRRLQEGIVMTLMPAGRILKH